MSSWKYIKILVKVALSILFTVIVLRKVDFSLAGEVLSNVNIPLALAALVATFIASLIGVARTYLLLRKETKKSFWELYLINRAGNFFNFFLLGGVGQELSRLSYIGDVKKKKLVYISLIDRGLGFLSLVVLWLFSIPFSKNLAFSPILTTLALVLTTVVTIAILLVLNKRAQAKHIPEAFMVSIIYSLGLIIIAHITFLAFGVDILAQLFWIIPALSILLMLPISIAGVGVREFFLIKTLGLSEEIIIAYAVISYLIYILLSLPGLVYFLHPKR